MANKQQPKKQPVKRTPRKRGRPAKKKTPATKPVSKCDSCNCLFKRIKRFFCKLFQR